jgi:hypothetical protein
VRSAAAENYGLPPQARPSAELAYHGLTCPLRLPSLPSYNTAAPCEGPMPFTIRPHRRFPVQCSVSYNAGPFQGQGTIWNLSRTGWRLSGDLPMRPGETLSLTVTLPNEQRIEVPEAVVRWSRGQEFAVENLVVELHTHARLQHYVKRLAKDSPSMISHR